MHRTWGWLAVTWLGCSGPKETSGDASGDADTDSDTDADTDTDTDADTDTDTDTDADTDTDETGALPEYFLEATGTFDGDPFSMSCGDGRTQPLTGAAAPFGAGEYSLTVGCNDDANTYGVGLGFIGGAPAAATACGFGASAQVTRVAGGYVSCLLGTTTSFSLDVTELTVDGAGDVVWAGTFEMASGDGTHEAQVSGSFRALAPAP